MSPTVAPTNHHGILRQSSSSVSKKLMLRSPSANQMKVQPSMDLSHSSATNSSYLSSSSSSFSEDGVYSLPLVGRNWGSHAAASPFKFFNPLSSVASIFRSFIPALQSLLNPTCHRLAVSPYKSPVTSPRSSSSRRKRFLTGTFFGQKKGRVSFAVQEAPRSEPILVLELATPTSHLVKEMASGTVRILLECERARETTKKALWDEPVWTMYCNGHKLGYATSRECTASDFRVLSTVQTVSVGAGVMPASPPLLPPPTAGSNPTETVKGAARNSDCGGGGGGGGAYPEIMYMRAKFDRVIGNRDSEAFYMINPDCTGSGDGGKFNSGGPELSIFMLRI